MRRTLALGIAGAALAASFLPLTSASAVCVTAWYTVTGQCSPCTTYANVNHRIGDKGPTLICLA